MEEKEITILTIKIENTKILFLVQLYLTVLSLFFFFLPLEMRCILAPCLSLGNSKYDIKFLRRTDQTVYLVQTVARGVMGDRDLVCFCLQGLRIGVQSSI